MLKKLIAATLIVTSVASISRAEIITAEPGDSLWTLFQKGLFETVYYGNNVIFYPIYYAADLIETQKQKILLQQPDVEADALFFKDHVLNAANGYLPTALYVDLTVNLKEGETLTEDVRDKETYNITKDVVVAVGPKIVRNDEIKGYNQKINGRLIISDNLYKAHVATHNLILDDVIAIPQSLQVKYGKYTPSTRGDTVNEMMLNYIKANRPHQRNLVR